MSDFTQMRKLAEQAMAEDKALRQQLAAAQERIAALENALRGMVDTSVNLTIAWESIWNDATGIVQAGISEQMAFNALVDELDDAKADAWLILIDASK